MSKQPRIIACYFADAGNADAIIRASFQTYLKRTMDDGTNTVYNKVDEWSLVTRSKKECTL